jgi:hypothetical protein
VNSLPFSVGHELNNHSRGKWISLSLQTNSARLFAQQKQADYGEHDANETLPRKRLVKTQNPSDGHDCSTGRQNAGHRGKRTALLKEQKKRDRAGADADSGEQRIIEARHTKFLTPASAQPQEREIKQDRQRRAGFDSETTETISDALGGEPSKDLVRAVKNSGDNCVPEPSCHKTRI